jgi:hypothetical protein
MLIFIRIDSYLFILYTQINNTYMHINKDFDIVPSPLSLLFQKEGLRDKTKRSLGELRLKTAFLFKILSAENDVCY